MSCVYPVERPCEVYTDSERVKEDRAVVLMLLKERAPESGVIDALCKAYGAADGSRFAQIDGEKVHYVRSLRGGLCKAGDGSHLHRASGYCKEDLHAL